MSSQIKLFLVTVSILLSFIAVVGYFVGVFMFDAAGYSKMQVKKMPLTKQYELLDARFKNLNDLIDEIKLVIDDGFVTKNYEWEDLDLGIVGSGSYGIDARPGTNSSNSYFLSSSKGISFAASDVDIKDLWPLKEYFEKENWRYNIETDDTVFVSHTIAAITKDNWYVRFVIRENGRYTLDVSSATFWGDKDNLQELRLQKIGFTNQ